MLKEKNVMISKTLGSDVSLTAGSPKALLSVTLTPGTWILNGCVRGSADSGGYRIVNISTSSASITTGSATGGAYEQENSSGSGFWCVNVSRIVKISSNTTYYLNVQQNDAGSARGGQSHLLAVKIV